MDLQQSFRVWRKTFFALLLLLAMVAAACAQDSDSTADSASGGEDASASGWQMPDECSRVTPFAELQDAPTPSEEWDIAVILPHQQDGGTRTAAIAAEQEGEKLGVNVQVQDAGGYQNVDKQISMIETAISEKVDALVVWATDPTATAPFLVQAQEAGIVTIGWISPPKSQLDDWPARGKVDALITGDYESNAYEIAKCLSEAVNGEGKAINVLAGAGSAFNADEVNGSTRGFDEYSGVEVVAEKSIPGFDAQSTQDIVDDVIVANPDVNIIHTTTISMAQGAVAALRAAGMAGEVAIGGLDVTTLDDIQLLRTGEIALLMGERPAFWGEAAVRAAITLLEGESLSATELFLTENPIYTDAETLCEHLDDELAPELQKNREEFCPE